MDSRYDLDDETIEALLAGHAPSGHPDLAGLIADLRAYATTLPRPGSELARLLDGTAPPVAQVARRRPRVPSAVAKIGVAAAAVIAGTGGLALAGALPAPIQAVLSHLDSGRPSRSHSQAKTVAALKTTTIVPTTTSNIAANATSTSVRTNGEQVSAVAHDHNNIGCDHGHAVAAAASDDKSHGQPCHPEPTGHSAATPASAAHNPRTLAGDPRTTSHDSVGQPPDAHHPAGPGSGH
ncbi:MAG TPA: hypothetical protein VN636_10665 [Acidimicrobiia bacterium]|nr:hypothetical protein [Acidimicrobiia bacterium]